MRHTCTLQLEHDRCVWIWHVAPAREAVTITSWSWLLGGRDKKMHRNQEEGHWRTTRNHCFENLRRSPQRFRSTENLATYSLRGQVLRHRRWRMRTEMETYPFLRTGRPVRWVETAPPPPRLVARSEYGDRSLLGTGRSPRQIENALRYAENSRRRQRV